MNKRYWIPGIILIVICCVSAVFINDITKHKEESYSFESKEFLDRYLPRISKRHIKELKIRDINLTPENLAIIKKFRNLEHLQISNCQLGDNELEFIAELNNLETLMLYDGKFPAINITDAELVHLEKLHNLTRLELSSKGVTDKGLSHLAELSGLERLALRHSNITDEGLSHFASLHNLQVLSLNHVQITGSGFLYLKDLKSLQSLGCSDTLVNDEGLKHIAQFRELRGISLTDTETTDAGLAYLTSNYWLLRIHPSNQMTEESLWSFRETLLENRRQARDRGILVPPDDALQISHSSSQELMKTMLPSGYFVKLEEFIESEQARRKTP